MVGTGTDRFVDATAETEVEWRLPLEVDMKPDRILKDIPIYPGAVRLDAFGPDSEGQCRLELPERGQTKVSLKWFVVTPHSGTSWAVTRGRGTARGFRRRPVHIQVFQPVDSQLT